MADDFGDDGALVAALRAGNEQAFVWLLDRYDASLHRVARTFLGSDAAVDEVVQDTWLGVIEGIDRFEQRSSLKTWIFHIMTNKAKTRGVGDRRTVPFASIDDGLGPTIEPDRFFPPDHDEWPGHWASPPPAWENLPEARLEANETLDQVRAALAGLPDAHRRVIALRDVEGLSSDEVCAVLGLTPANERVLLHRARGRVRARLERYFDSEEVT